MKCNTIVDEIMINAMELSVIAARLQFLGRLVPDLTLVAEVSDLQKMSSSILRQMLRKSSAS